MKTYITNKVLLGLGAICLVLALADFWRNGHGAFEVERAPLFFAVFGFVTYAALIFLSKVLRRLVMRPEDYYGNRATDEEDESFAGAEKQVSEAPDA
ncbi:hypothetical protein [Parvibaculum sp.]|uniref:hypothetical protein n=1 Tax=Parvibaculum sp. TaxID=2024848 RepID=UPI0032116756